MTTTEERKQARIGIVEHDPRPYLVFWSRCVERRQPQSSSHASIVYAYSADDAITQWRSVYADDLHSSPGLHAGRVYYGSTRPPVTPRELSWIERGRVFKDPPDGVVVSFHPSLAPGEDFQIGSEYPGTAKLRSPVP